MIKYILTAILAFIAGVVSTGYYFVIYLEEGFTVFVKNLTQKEISRFELFIDNREVILKGIPSNEDGVIDIPQSKEGVYDIKVVFSDGSVLMRKNQKVKPGTYQYEIVRNDNIEYLYRGK